MTSSNNRDGLAIKTTGHGLLQREEDKKILIVLSDGKPYDAIMNGSTPGTRSHIKVRLPSQTRPGKSRRLRNLDVSVLGVFAGEEKDLSTEKKIFGKDFAYIRDISNFSRIVGRYLTKQLEVNE